MRICSTFRPKPVRFRTEISVGFCGQTAKFLRGKLNRGASLPLALGLEKVAGHVE